MDRLEITVPDLNDSMSRVVLSGAEYNMRFSWNECAQRWSYGLYTMEREPIIQWVRIVPRWPLALQSPDERMPRGALGAYCDLPAIGRHSFANGEAVFAYIPLDQRTLP